MKSPSIFNIEKAERKREATSSTSLDLLLNVGTMEIVLTSWHTVVKGNFTMKIINIEPTFAKFSDCN